jgi:hypothetical protein
MESMMNAYCLFFIAALCCSNGVAFEAPNTSSHLHNMDQQSPAKSSSTPKLTTNHIGIFYEPGMPARSGAENILALHSGVSFMEEKVLGTSWLSDGDILGKSCNIAGRFAKYFLVDIPINFLFIVVNHEFYGHASRYREFDLDPIDYHFETPPIYGPGGGFAHVSSYPRPMSNHELLAIWQGGFEAHNLLNRRLSMRWIADKRINYHESILYLWTWQDRFQYIQGANEKLPADLSGELFDPEGYVWFLNKSAGYDNPHNLYFSMADLKRKDQMNLINPFVWIALFTQFKSYLYDGNRTATLPMLRFGEIDYLPSLRMSLTPFGPQYHVENYLRWRRTTSLIELRIGDQTFHKDWWGIGLLLQNIYEKKQFSFDLHLDVWRQPQLEINGTSVTASDAEFGLAFSIRGYYDVLPTKLPLSLIAEMGYKSTGYIQGYVLDATPKFMLGIGLRK